jgi:hypothetical protein
MAAAAIVDRYAKTVNLFRIEFMWVKSNEKLMGS